MHRRSLYIAMLLFVCTLAAEAQQTDFPYPDIPDEVEEPQRRLSYMLTHFWSGYTFADSTQANRQAGEQGIADFLNLMHHADSLTAAKGAAALADSLAAHPDAAPFFTELLERYLSDPESPLHDEDAHAHMLRALPPTPQRTWLLQQLAKNPVGSHAADIAVTLDDGHQCPLHDVEAPLTLIIFFDPDCERCRHLDTQMANTPAIAQNAHLRVVRKNVNDLKGEYHIPHTPTFYLLDSQKRVVLKAPSWPVLLQALQEAEP